jgi:putative ABC transport system substrate-binding protein
MSRDGGERTRFHRCDAISLDRRRVDRHQRRSALAITIVLAILLSPLPGESQQAATTVYRIGYLHSGAPPALPAREALALHLREHGWVDGQNIVFEDRFAEGKWERLPAMVSDLLRLKVAVLVTPDTPTTIAAKQATQSVPIVMSTGDPLRTGLIASLARPGGNITGLDVATVDVRAKSLQLLREVVPQVSQIGFLMRPGNPALLRSWQELETAAPTLGVKLRRFDVREAADIEHAFALMARDRVGGVVVPSDPAVLNPLRQKIVDLAAKSRMPAMYPWRYFVEIGGLMSYGNDLGYNNRLLASYVDRILRGAKPGDLPIERPAKLELVINLRTAHALGIQMPPSLLARADEIIQ